MFTDDQLKAIGCLAIESTNLEHYLDLIIQSVCDFDEETFLIFFPPSRASISPKIQALNNIVQLNPGLDVVMSKFKKTYSDMTDAVTKRNTIIHGDWRGQNLEAWADAGRRRSDSEAIRRGVKQKIKASEIMKVADQMAHLQMELVNWFRTYRSTVLHSLRETRLEELLEEFDRRS